MKDYQTWMTSDAPTDNLLAKHPGDSERIYMFRLFQELNDQFFEGSLKSKDWPIFVSKNLWPKLLGKFFIGRIEINRALLEDYQKLRYVTFHLMIHAWLFGMGLPYDHSMEFYQKELEYDQSGWVFQQKKAGLLKGLDRDFNYAITALKNRSA